MPTRAALALTFFLLSAGCATLSGEGLRTDAERRGIVEEVVRSGGTGGALSAEAEATITFAGRSVSLPAALLLHESGAFRIDLLDPFDRPAAIIFGQGEKIVQYQPAAAAAAALRPYPGSCPEPGVGAWVPALLGRYPGPGSWRLQSLFGRISLVRHESGALVQKVALGRKGEKWLPRKVTWYCREDPVLHLDLAGAPPAEKGAPPSRLLVSYPAAHLKIELLLGNVEGGALPDPRLLKPLLPPGTAWKNWDLVSDED